MIFSMSSSGFMLCAVAPVYMPRLSRRALASGRFDMLGAMNVGFLPISLNHSSLQLSRKSRRNNFCRHYLEMEDVQASTFVCRVSP